MQDKTIRVGKLEVKIRDKPRSHTEHEDWERKKRKQGTRFEISSEDANRKRKRYTMTLSAQAHAIAKKLANGNVSRGVEKALLHWFDCPRTDGRRRK